MKMIFWNLFSIFGLFALVAGQLNYGSKTNLPRHLLDDPNFSRPTFQSLPQNISAPEGSDVSFPCEFDATGLHENIYMMIFKYVSPKDEDRIYYAGETKVTHFPRIKKDGFSFTLNNVKATDSGSYICRFETKPLTQVVHRLEVLYPPKVWRESAELQRIPQGSNLLLQCSADGNPTPQIIWSKQRGVLPSGLQTEQGSTVTFENVDRHVEGTYMCTASNGVGAPTSASMTVQVEYAPEIISEQSIIHTGEGEEAVLACVVHGRPTPNVTWLRGDNLVSSGKHVMTHDGAYRHTLTIMDVTEEDFGEYTCKAFNDIGTVMNKFEVTGLPKKPMITSNGVGSEETSFDLIWISETSSPLVQYRLKYKEMKSKRRNKSFDWRDSLFFPNNKDVSQVRPGVYEITHRLKHLRPGGKMQAAVQVENKFGWSLLSDIFEFETKKEELTTTTPKPSSQTFNHGPKVEEVALGNSSYSAPLSFHLTLIFTSFVIMRFYH